jgi:hypothetical protein
VGDGAHAAHEFIYVEETLARAALLSLLLLAPAIEHAPERRLEEA